MSENLDFYDTISGVGGIEGDGNVYRPDNLDEFRKFVWDSTDGKGCHFVMADGVGFCLHISHDFLGNELIYREYILLSQPLFIVHQKQYF